MTTEFQYDVLPKPNQADKPRVPRLAERLRPAGLGQTKLRNSGVRR